MTTDEMLSETEKEEAEHGTGLRAADAAEKPPG